jgi:hypothetical protein
LKRTTKYNLPLAEPTDKYSYAKDNEALEIIDSELSSMADSVQAVEQQIKEVPTINANAEVQEARKGFELLGDKIADMDNKINSASGVGSATTQEVVAARSGKVSLKAKIDSIDSSLADIVHDQGDITQLNTNDKSSVVNAVKEIKSQANNNATAIVNIGNASPKGIYSTLSALQTAFPTGTTGIYVVTADGNWYYWNGSAWKAGGVYQSTGVADNSITMQKLSGSAVRKNLFNKATPGYYINQSTGDLVTGAGFYYSEYIPVQPNTSYVKGGTYTFAYYDSSKTFISGGRSSEL